MSRDTEAKPASNTEPAKVTIERLDAEYAEILKNLNIDKIMAFLDGKKKTDKLSGPATQLYNYFEGIKTTMDETKESDKASVATDKLKDANRYINNFIASDKYEFSSKDESFINALIEYNSKLSAIYVKLSAKKYDNSFESAKKSIELFEEIEKKTVVELKKHYSDVYKDEFDPDTLDDDLKKTKEEIKKLKAKVEADNNAIDDFKILNSSIEKLEIQINEDEELKKYTRLINIFDKLMNAYDPKTKKAIADADNKVNNLEAKINEINERIAKDQANVEENKAASAEYLNATAAVFGMEKGCALFEKGLKSEVLDQKYNALQNAFGHLTRLSMQMKKDNTNLKTAEKKYPGFNNIYKDAKDTIIKNFDVIPEDKALIIGIFSKIDSDKTSGAIDLLVEGNKVAFFDILETIKENSKAIKAYVETSDILNRTKDKHKLLEDSLADIDKSQKELEETKKELAKAKDDRTAQKDLYFSTIKTDNTEKDRIRNLSNKDFYDKLAGKKKHYEKLQNERLNGELKLVKEALEEKSQKKETIKESDLNKQLEADIQSLTIATEKGKKLKTHTENYEKIKKHFKEIEDKSNKVDAELLNKNFGKVDEQSKIKLERISNRPALKKMYEVGEKLIAENLEPERYEGLKTSLTNIKNKLDAIKNSKDDSMPYKNMYEKIVECLTAAEIGHSGTLSSALGALKYETGKYLEVHKIDKWFFRSADVRSRYTAAKELFEIGNTANIFIEPVVGVDNPNPKSEKTAKEICKVHTGRYIKKQLEGGVYFQKLNDAAKTQAKTELNKTQPQNQMVK